jgi:glycosyltransferase involved in cell wall biosynthesis
VSVIVATYRPGDALSRVLDSVDAQTLPADEFEVLFVDDGSPDDTFERLQRIAATRPNVVALQVEHSGWPSRPRNVGIERARGEYLVFMDHDDSLYPDALRRAYEFASENDADVVAVKELKSNDVWWSTTALAEGNLANALHVPGIPPIDRLRPMMPHKLYRRALFLEHGIRFPEGGRVLWEDVYINVAAFRHAKVVSVLADTPFYLWHSSDQNSSHTFDHTRDEFWDRLEDLLEFIAQTLDGPENRDAHDAALAWELAGRVIHRAVLLVDDLKNADLPTRARGMKRAQKLLSRYTSDSIYARLGKRQRAMLHLIRAGRMDRIQALRRAEAALAATISTDSVQWDADGVSFETLTRWGPLDPSQPAFREQDGRIVRALGPDLEGALPAELIDVTADAISMSAKVAVRSRPEFVTWTVTHHTEPAEFGTDEHGALALLQRGRCRIDFGTAAFGHPLEDTVWDVRAKTAWLGITRPGALLFDGPPSPALLAGNRAAVAYTSKAKGLTLDFAQRLRTFAIDAAPQPGPIGDIGSFSARLENVTVLRDGSETALDVDTLFALDDAKVPIGVTGDALDAALEELAAAGSLDARIVTDADGARLEGKADLAPGEYTIYARREGRLNRTERTLRVDADGAAELG